MRNLRLCVALALLCPAVASGQAITAVTSPASSITIKVANEFATRAFQDPWDMNQRADVGPWLGSADAVMDRWGTFTFTGGLFTGTTAAGDAQLWLLDTSNPNAEPLGKTGANFPIDAGTYKVFAVRMTRPSGASQAQAQVLTWPNNIYESSPTAHPSGALFGGTGVYFINLGASGFWTGTQRALRFQPTPVSGETVSVDWARLVPAGDSNSCKAIQWTGGLGPDGIADIYLDNDNNFSNGLYGVVQPFATDALISVPTSASRASAGCPVVSGAFNFHIGALPAGTYYAVVVPLNQTPSLANAKYSPGSWTINDAPTLKFTSPTDEGSDDDFATSQIGDAWDMDKLADLDTTFNITSPAITTLNMEAPDGTSLPNQRVFQATSVTQGACPSDGDPVLVPLDFSKRGTNFLINTDRYRLLTVEFGIPVRPRDLVCGSIGRVIWHKKGNAVDAFTVTNDIIFNQRSGVNLLDKVTLDLKTTCIEPATSGSCNTDWTNGAQGGVDHFRFDPHEFATATPFYVKRIKLADYERAKVSYTIRWTYSDPVGAVDLYYDLDPTGFNGTLIAAGINATTGQYTWVLPSNLPTAAGTRVHIYAVFRDVNALTCPASDTTCSENQVYAPLPIIADSTFTEKPRVVLSRRSLNFGALGNTSIATAPQTVRLSFVGPATNPCWSIGNSNPGGFAVSPTTGNGNATLTVSLTPQTFPGGGTAAATFTVNECTAGTILNPGQTFTATSRITQGAAPFGAVDEPADNITVAGSVGMTGWAVDDIDIATVKIYRNGLPGDPADGLGRVFIGDASRVDDARTDIAAANPDAPFNYRAGWGYLILTNFLPNQGNGPVVLSAYATDRDGHEVLLGQRTINTNNNVSTEPFGAIDTPGQGETISGANYANFGWVLARGFVHADPPHGGTVTVVIDGAFVGSPGGWVARSDLTALFPKAQYDGVDNALGAFVLNTTTMTDGVHTIAWVVIANNGQGAGIGSRYFTTVNGNNNLTLDPQSANVFSAPAPTINAFPNLGRRVTDVARLDRASEIRATRAGSLRPVATVTADPTGLRTVFSPQLERVAVDASVPGVHTYEAYRVAGDTLTPLPIGASFDDRRGILYWQPGVGYIGSYDFVVVRDGRDRLPVRVVLTPQSRRPAPSRLMRGLFAAE